MWTLRFRFTKPPRTIAEFQRSGRRLRATGRGSVQILGPRGCSLREELPFALTLRGPCFR
jgi:hypothetical protein